jgi:hypothetical protein
MAPLAIARADLKPTLDAHRGNDALRAAFVSAVAKPEKLLNVVCRYIQFNGAFGPGLANLSGEIAARQGLFRDAAEPVEVIADRAAEVAADFFHAAVDEYDDRATPWRDTHRTLAQACLKGMAAYYGYEAQRLNQVLRVNKTTHDAMASVFDGYGIGARLEDRRLFTGMGFHAGSEVLADQEFTIIDAVLRERLPEMVKALTGMKVRVGRAPEEHKAYYWISIHTSVEADHFDSAVQGVNKALSYYVGENDPQAVKDWILEGFRDFAKVQGDFMAGLASEEDS